MVCPECGQSVAVAAKLCPRCGHVLRVSGLRVRHPKNDSGDMGTAKRSALTPTHPRLPQAPSAAILADTGDPWQGEWLATAKRPLSADAADARGARRYLLPGVIALGLLLACMGIALVLHGALFTSAAPAKAPVSATMTSVPTATTAATSTIAPTATTASGYVPPPAATATPKTMAPTATATSPVVIVTATVMVDPTATGAATKTPTPKPTATATH